MASDTLRFGPYEIVRRLGAGGMAETFVAIRRGPAGFEQRVCLKRVLPAYSADKEFARLFLEEAKLAAKLRHSNCVGVIDFGEHEGTYYLALELVDGVDLRALLSAVAGGKLPHDQIKQVVIDLALALDHAHTKTDERPGVVHRDVTPSNVLISRAGEVKLVDFGIAKAMRSSGATASQTIKGKIPYMAPEQIQGLAVDARTDLFALGVMLYEMLSGERPFRADSDVAVMHRILLGQREPLADVAPDAPPELIALTEHLLAQEPADRPTSALAMLTTLSPPSPMARRLLGELAGNALDAREASPEGSGTLAAAQPSAPNVAPASERPLAATRQSSRPRPEVADSSRPVVSRGAWLALTVAITVAAAVWMVLQRRDEPPAPRTEPKPAASAAVAAQPSPPALPAAPSVEPEEAGAAAPLAAATPIDEPIDARKSVPRASGRRARKDSTAPVDPLRAAPTPPGSSEATALRSVLRALPWGDIAVDGQDLGRSPLTLKLAPGDHTVVVSQRGERRLTRKVRVEAGRPNEFDLELPELSQ